MEHISLDGVIQHENDEGFAQGDWTMPYRSPAGLAAVMAAQGSRFALLLGRRTYDIWAGYWPKAGDGPMANALNAATKYVATHRPDSLGWGPVVDLGPDFRTGQTVADTCALVDVPSTVSCLLKFPFKQGQGKVMTGLLKSK